MDKIAELLMTLPVAILHFRIICTLLHALSQFLILHFIRLNFHNFALLKIYLPFRVRVYG